MTTRDLAKPARPRHAEGMIVKAVGVELNRLVAEQVMGWTDLREIGQSGAMMGRHPRWGNTRVEVPAYSEIALASADVADEMVNRGFEFTLSRTQRPAVAGAKCSYEATFTLWSERGVDPATERATCRHEEEAVAVCRAALLALKKVKATNLPSQV